MHLSGSHRNDQVPESTRVLASILRPDRVRPSTLQLLQSVVKWEVRNGILCLMLLFLFAVGFSLKTVKLVRPYLTLSKDSTH